MSVDNKNPEDYKTLDDPVCPDCGGGGYIGQGVCATCEGDGRVKEGTTTREGTAVTRERGHGFRRRAE